MAQHRSLVSKNMILRLVTIVFFAPFALWIIMQGGMVFNTAIIFLAVLMGIEWNRITKSVDSPGWQLIGAFYITASTISFIWIAEQTNGMSIIYSLIAMVWATDIGAYIFGKLIGGPKICPELSPKKTWAGLLGGMVSASLTGLLMDELIYMGAAVAVVAQLGDFLESWVKRRFKVDDSGNLFPGHGGVLDRMDGLLLVAPVTALLMLLTN
jgi:phosphatidate cytidylyltransferase